MFNLLFQDVVGWQTNGVFNALEFQILVNLWFGKGGVAPEELTHPLVLVTFHRQCKEFLPTVRMVVSSG